MPPLGIPGTKPRVLGHGLRQLLRSLGRDRLRPEFRHIEAGVVAILSVVVTRQPGVARFHESSARSGGLRRPIRRPARLKSRSARVARSRTRFARSAGQTRERRSSRAPINERALPPRARGVRNALRAAQSGSVESRGRDARPNAEAGPTHAFAWPRSLRTRRPALLVESCGELFRREDPVALGHELTDLLRVGVVGEQDPETILTGA